MAVTQFETLAYNGFRFPVESELEVSATPRYDRADRTVVAVDHELTVTMTVQKDGLLGQFNETFLPTLKSQLCESGAALVLTGTGFGDLSVGGNAAKKDVSWGPKPRLLRWRPLGTTACEVVWRCLVSVPVCQGAAFEGQIMAYNYTVTQSRDLQGYVTRTVAGYFEVPKTRENGAGPFGDPATNFLNSTTLPSVPFGFRRVSMTATNSDDRRRVDFSVVDEEMPSVYPPATAVECQASQTVNAKAVINGRCTSTIRASYTLVKGIDKATASTYFLALVFDRMRAQQRAGAVQFLPVELTFEDPDIYGRRAANFSFTYAYFVNIGGAKAARSPTSEGLHAIIPRSALWRPPPKAINDYPTWRKSMNTVFDPDQGARFRAGKDKIIDLCSPDLPVTVGDTFFRVKASPYSSVELLLALRETIPIVDDVRVRVIARPNVMFTPFLDPDWKDKLKKFITNTALKTVATSVYGALGFLAGEVIVGEPQNLAAPTLLVVLYYRRVFVGKSPKRPVLLSVDGSKRCVPDNRFSHDDTYQVGNYFGQPASARVGYCFYRVLDMPGDAPNYPTNTFLNSDQYSVSDSTGEGLGV